MQVSPEAEEDPISVSSSGTAHIGSVQLLDFTFRSEDREYDNDLNAYVYVDGQLAGMATKLAYDVPEYWEADPGYQFEFSLPVHTTGHKEVEIFVTNGADTFTAYTTIKVEESPFTDDYQFLKSLWNGLFDREPEIAELGAIMGRLSSFEYNRNQIFEQLRLTQEFVKARNILLLRKTLFGRWDTVETALFDISPQQLAERDGINSVIPASQRPDDGDTHLTATRVEMNDVVYGRFETDTDEDWFRIESFETPAENGVLEVIVESNSTNIITNFAYAVFPNGDIAPLNDLDGGEGIDLFDLTQVNFAIPEYFAIQLIGDRLTKTDYKMTIRNQVVLTRERLRDSLDNLGKVYSPINEFQVNETINYLTGTFDYTNTYGSLRNESRENLFLDYFETNTIKKQIRSSSLGEWSC